VTACAGADKRTIFHNELPALFRRAGNPRQRQYEALRAFYLDGLTSAHAAERFGYSPGAFRVLCHAFRRGELPEFFAATRPGPRDQPKKSAAQEQIIACVSATTRSTTSVVRSSSKERRSALPRCARYWRRRALRVAAPARRGASGLVGPTTEAVADVRSFTLAPREFTTRMGGLFLFIPDLVRFEVEALAVGAKLPGSRMIPAAHALRASLALKLWAIERKSHVMLWWPTRGSRCSAVSTRCRSAASWPNIPRRSPAEGLAPDRPLA